MADDTDDTTAETLDDHLKGEIERLRADTDEGEAGEDPGTETAPVVVDDGGDDAGSGPGDGEDTGNEATVDDTAEPEEGAGEADADGETDGGRDTDVAQPEEPEEPAVQIPDDETQADRFARERAEAEAFVQRQRPRNRRHLEAALEREQTLEGQRDEASQHARVARDSAEQLYGYINDSHAKPEDMTAVLGLIKAWRTGDMDSARVVWDRVRQMVDTVGVGLGHMPAGNNGAGNLLEHFPDLQKGVEELDLTEKHAQEIALGRMQSQQRQHYGVRNAQVAQQEQQVSSAKQSSYNEIVQWEADLKKSDPDFAMKRDKLMPVAEEIMKSMPNSPEYWLPALEREWRSLTVGFDLAATRREQERASSPNTLRPGVRTGAAPAAPTTLDEHVKMELARIRGEI